MEKEIERFYLDTIGGGDAYLEVNWNNAATEDDMVRITVNDNRIVIRREDLETVMFLLTENTDKYIENKSRKAAVKYMPVREKEYQKYLEGKKTKNNIHKKFY